jgi:hypothetical protein
MLDADLDAPDHRSKRLLDRECGLHAAGIEAILRDNGRELV